MKLKNLIYKVCIVCLFVGMVGTSYTPVFATNGCDPNLQPQKTYNISVKDYAENIETANGVKEIPFDYTTLQTEIGDRTATEWNATPHSDKLTMVEGKTYVAEYPQALEYNGQKISVKMEVSVDYPEQLGVGGTYVDSKIGKLNNKIYIFATSYGSNVSGANFRKHEFRAQVSVKTSFFDETGEPFEFTGLYGFQDPDGGEFIFDMTGRDLYYIDGRVSGTNFQAGDPEYASEAFIVKQNGIYFAQGQINPAHGGIKYGYNEALFFVALKNESEFSFVESISNDTIHLPYFYALNTEQHAKVEIHDDTADTLLSTSDALSGESLEDIGYNVEDAIKTYLEQGYEYVSDDVKDAKYDVDECVDQTFTIHLKHGEETLNAKSPNAPNGAELEKEIKRTIHYRYYSETGEQASEDVAQSAKFERTVTIDKVTGEILRYSDYSPENTTFEAVSSPKINGFKPSLDDVNEKTISNTDNDEEVFVIYNDGEQTAILKIVENNKELDSHTWSGASGADLSYDPTELIKTYTDKGYEVVSSDYPDNGKFDRNDDVDQEYTVVLQPIIEEITFDTPKLATDEMNPNGDTYPSGLTESDLKKTISRTIHYRYLSEDGEIASEDVVQPVVFTRTATVNHVTGEVTYTGWYTDNSVLEEVVSPHINGYVPSKEKIELSSMTAESTDSEIYVIYTTSEQVAHFTIKHGEEELFSTAWSGNSGESLGRDIEKDIKALTDKGYKLLSNDYPENGLFDFDDENDQYFVAIVEPIIEPITVDNLKTTEDEMNPDGTKYPEGLTRSFLVKDVTRDIYYRYIVNTGNKAAEDVKQSAELIRTATVNHVTGEIVYSKYKTNTDKFDAVESPKINGYTSSKTVVEELEINADSTSTFVYVIYTPSEQIARFRFVDEDGKSLDHDIIHTGVSMSTINTDDVAEKIKDIIDLDYTLISSEVENELKFDADDGVEQVFTVIFRQNKYKVVFMDGEGNVLKSEEVVKYASATAPKDPERKGFTFKGWDIAFNNVTKNLVVTAKWEEIPSVKTPKKPKIVNTADTTHTTAYLMLLSASLAIALLSMGIRIKYRGQS